MEVAGQVKVLGLAESSRADAHVGSGRRTSVGEMNEVQAATLIQANIRGSQLRRQLAAEEEEDEDYQHDPKDQRTTLVSHGLRLASIPGQTEQKRAPCKAILYSIYHTQSDWRQRYRWQVDEAEALLRAKGERQQAAADSSRKKRREAEAAAVATEIATGAASAAYAQQARHTPLNDEQAAATRIQSMQRGKQARRELQEQRRAATQIAAAQRGKQERRRVRTLTALPEPEPEHTPVVSTDDNDSEEAGS